MRKLDWCSHGYHEGPCLHKYTETIRDDVGYGVKPTGQTRVILVDVCQCEGAHE